MLTVKGRKSILSGKNFSQNLIRVISVFVLAFMEEEEWVIEKVLRKRNNDARTTSIYEVVREPEYLIRWEGYSEEHDSWHTKDELQTMFGRTLFTSF